MAEVKQAVGQGKAVVACVYTNHLPQSVRDQLPNGLRGQYVLRMEGGKVVESRPGLAEEVMPALLAARHR